MSKLKDKVAIVTGASKGIGAAIAKSLAAAGASVVVNYASSKAGADAVVSAITSAGGKAVAVGGDVSKAAEAQGIVDAAVKEYGHLDIVVNNSGVYAFGALEEITEESFHHMFNINVLGLLLVTKAASKHLGEGASIINIGSAVTRTLPANERRLQRHKGAVDAITGVLSRNSDRGKSASIASTPAWSRQKASTPPASSARTSRKASSPKLRSAESASPATSHPSPSSSRATIPPGSRVTILSPAAG